MSRARIYDVTVPVSSRLPVWPGDPPVRTESTCENGVTVTRLELGSHTGTHVDVPHHMIPGAPSLDQVPVQRWMGPCRVVAIDAPAIRATELRRVDLDGVRKVLFRTRNAGRLKRRRFDPDYVAIDPSGAQYLVKRGIELVGIDYLSVERFRARGFPAHHVLMNSGVLIIEGLDLSKVPPGDYELICLPLRLKGGDGAPARVVLRTM